MITSALTTVARTLTHVASHIARWVDQETKPAKFRPR